MNIKTAIVSGGVQGIGKAIVKRLIRDGYYTVIADINESEGNIIADELDRENSTFIKCDICNETEVENLFSEIIKEKGQLNAVINNAGIIRDNMIWNMTKEDFNLVVDINLKGTWIMCREAAKI